MAKCYYANHRNGDTVASSTQSSCDAIVVSKSDLLEDQDQRCCDRNEKSSPDNSNMCDGVESGSEIFFRTISKYAKHLESLGDTEGCAMALLSAMAVEDSVQNSVPILYSSNEDSNNIPDQIDDPVIISDIESNKVFTFQNSVLKCLKHLYDSEYYHRSAIFLQAAVECGVLPASLSLGSENARQNNQPESSLRGPDMLAASVHKYVFKYIYIFLKFIINYFDFNLIIIAGFVFE